MIQEVRADRDETCISAGRLPELPVWFIRICFPLNISLQSHPFLALHVPHQFAIKPRFTFVTSLLSHHVYNIHFKFLGAFHALTMTYIFGSFCSQMERSDVMLRGLQRK